MKKGMIKGWILQEEHVVETETSYTQFAVKDRCVKVKYTFGAMRYIWYVGGFVCLLLLRVFDVVLGICAGLLGLGVLLLIYRILTRKRERTIHLICYTARDETREDFFGIDTVTKEILSVQHVYADPKREYPMEMYGFETVDVEYFKNYFVDKSDRLYNMVRNIYSETVVLLQDIQFGETDCQWIRFIKKKENDIYKIGCYSVTVTGEMFAKYVKMPDYEYEKLFRGCGTLYEQYKMFALTRFAADDERILCGYDRQLLEDEVNMLCSVYQGDKTLSNENIEVYFCRDFIKEYEKVGSALVTDVKGLQLLERLLSD